MSRILLCPRAIFARVGPREAVVGVVKPTKNRVLRELLRSTTGESGLLVPELGFVRARRAGVFVISA
jgi:hypothetical protein